MEGAHDAGLHVEKVYLARSRPHEHRGRMPRRAVRERGRHKVNDAHEERRERLDAREAEKELVERAHHARGRKALPRVRAQRRLDGRRDRGRLHALARDVAHDHAGAPPRQADEVVEVAAHKGGLGCRGVDSLRRKAVHVLQDVAHARLERLGDALVLLAPLLAQEDVAHVAGKRAEKRELARVEGLGAVRAQHKAAAPLARQLARVHEGAHTGLPQVAQDVVDVRAREHRHHGHVVLHMALLGGVEVDGHGAHARDGELRHQDALVDVLLEPHVNGIELLGRLRKGLLGAGGKVLVALGGIQELLAQLGATLVEPLRSLLAHGREGPHELHREVMRNRVEQARVVCVQRARARPAHLDDGNNVAAKPHRHGKEARKGRKQAPANA